MEMARNNAELTMFGIRRQVDDLGRITTPAEFRALLKFLPRQSIAFSSVEIPGFGSGVFVFATKDKIISGRRVDELGRFTIPIRVCTAFRIEKRGWVELLPIHHNELGYGLFVHSVPSACVVEDE